MNKLIRIPGIVISASVLSSRATKLHLQCRACRSIKTMYPTAGLGGLGGGAERGLPRVCDAPEPEGQKKDCPMDPYLVIHSKSTFSDHQTLKLQEAPDMVPVGELPRHIILSTDRYNTGQVVPGSRVIATGIYSTFNSSKSVRSRASSVLLSDNQPDTEIIWYICTTDAVPSSCSPRVVFTIYDGYRWSQPFRCPIYPRRRGGVQRDGQERWILPSFRKKRCSKYFWKFGYIMSGFYQPCAHFSPDIKKAITCLLFGGSKKVLPDGMRLRGDINLLLLGDPGTAKSQLLKFVEKVRSFLSCILAR